MNPSSLRLSSPLFCLILAACGGHSPTSPGPTDSYSLSTSLTNNTGAATIVDAQIIIDKVVVYDSCPPQYQSPTLDTNGDPDGFVCVAPPVASVPLVSSGAIGPGNHQLIMLLSQISPNAQLNPYTMAAFNIVIHSPTGALLKTISLPSQTATLGPGSNGGPREILYGFSF
jgi:hypothetical protein